MEKKIEIYHEKQRLQFCLLHALNNLLQVKESFTKAELDAIADKLAVDDTNEDSWSIASVIWKPHHNSLTGNYDVNVLIAALEGKGKKVVWHDRRNDASAINLDQSPDTLTGLMLNVPVKRFAGLWNSRHWIAVRRIHGLWYNLDSDLREPVTFKDDNEMKEFLNASLTEGGEILIILEDEE
ncbi:josephin-like protein [Nymphaea colorata]|nr:josephin-like protein [Nymphaea colorata]